jgi:hypothetical protein
MEQIKHIPLAQLPKASKTMKRILAPCGHYLFTPDNYMEAGLRLPKCQQCIADSLKDAEFSNLYRNMEANRKAFGKEEVPVLPSGFTYRLRKLFNH